MKYIHEAIKGFSFAIRENNMWKRFKTPSIYFLNSNPDKIRSGQVFGDLTIIFLSRETREYARKLKVKIIKRLRGATVKFISVATLR